MAHERCPDMKEIIQHIIKAIGYSREGLKETWKSELAFRIEIVILAIILPLVFILDLSSFERLMLVGVWLFVIIVELINSAIESIVDRIGEEKHALSGRAKDQGAAAVLFAIIIAILTWFVILF